MPLFRITTESRCVIYATHVVEASTEEQARELVLQGEGELDRQEETDDFAFTDCRLVKAQKESD